jgi:hypothetical protein
MDETGGDVDPALHPARVLLDGFVGALGQGHDLQHVIDPLTELLAAEAIDASEELQVCAGAERRIEARSGDEAVDPPDFERMLMDVVTADPGCAEVGSRSPSASRSWWSCRRHSAQQAEDLAFLDVEADPSTARIAVLLTRLSASRIGGMDSPESRDADAPDS